MMCKPSRRCVACRYSPRWVGAGSFRYQAEEGIVATTLLACFRIDEFFQLSHTLLKFSQPVKQIRLAGRNAQSIRKYHGRNLAQFP